jgi:multidrug transporter EmrE-like cation transporter
MSQAGMRSVALARAPHVSAAMAGLIGLNVVFSILANAAFRASARGGTWSDVLLWQVLGNLAGFVTVLTLTALLRWIPLSIAFPVTTGLSIVAVQVVAARWLFAEPIAAAQWAGSLLIAAGIFLVQR